jgi:hypothetical protein
MCCPPFVFGSVLPCLTKGLAAAFGRLFGVWYFTQGPGYIFIFIITNFSHNLRHHLLFNAMRNDFGGSIGVLGFICHLMFVVETNGTCLRRLYGCNRLQHSDAQQRPVAAVGPAADRTSCNSTPTTARVCRSDLPRSSSPLSRSLVSSFFCTFGASSGCKEVSQHKSNAWEVSMVGRIKS